jgi:hypothetical protein
MDCFYPDTVRLKENRMLITLILILTVSGRNLRIKAQMPHFLLTRTGNL